MEDVKFRCSIIVLKEMTENLAYASTMAEAEERKKSYHTIEEHA